MSGEITIYKNQAGNIELEVRLEDQNLWLNQGQIALLFGKARSTITEHIQHIFAEGELQESVVCRNFRLTSLHGAIAEKTQEQEVKHYNLELILAVGYRVKSVQGTQFRIWATERLKEYIIKGFALNEARLKSGNSLQYFDELQEKLRAIRLSEKIFYQKIKDIYTTSYDYDPKDEKTIAFFKIVQNKLLWAISEQTAAELVYRRINANLPLLGMTSYPKNPESIQSNDVNTAKNYLNEDEMKLLGLLVEQYLAFAETMAQQQKKMYMKDWLEKLDAILTLNGRELLKHAGKISSDTAKEKSKIELKKYQETQKKIQYENSLKEIEKDLQNLQLTKKTKQSSSDNNILKILIKKPSKKT